MKDNNLNKKNIICIGVRDSSYLKKVQEARF